jgi:hypothetical protein
MANAGLRFEDRLEGASNFSPWRERIALVLEEQGLWEFVEGTPVPPADPTQLAAHIRKDVKARRIIIDGVKDHIIPHLSGKKTTKEMWESLTKLYQSDNQSRKDDAQRETQEHQDGQGRHCCILPHQVHSDQR